MTLARLSRIPKRLLDDLKIIWIAQNWREILRAKINRKPLSLIRLRNGVVLRSPGQVSLDFLFHEIWIDEVYAPPGYEIKNGDTVVDIGANIGVFATYAATSASGVKVKSYEPFPKNAEYFRVNLDASKLENVEFHQTAVADSEGVRTLHLDDAWILHSLTEKGSSENGMDVDCTTLDKVFEDIDSCGLLKLDCEGSEYEVLYSASDSTVSKISRIVCEFNNVDDDRKNGAALRDFLLTKGFEIDPSGPLDGESGFICARKNAI